MKKEMTIFFVGAILFLNSFTVYGFSQKFICSTNTIDGIDDYIIKEMQTNHIPGLSASIVIDEEVVWQNSYGYANIEENKKVVNETLFKIASVSKTLTATCLMQLYEQEFFDIYDPINNYLPFNVIHPLYPTNNITFHMLLTHSSGINDNWAYLFHFVGDSPISFQTFLQEYLVPGGLYYDEANNFCSWEPGTSWKYSNVGVALVGYLVENISGMNFTTYTENFLFSPLDMNESGWYLRDLNESHIAMPYHWNGLDYEPYGHIGWVDVPAGDLRTSSSQLINFLTMFINNGSYNSQEILNSETVSMMLTPQLSFNPNLGLIWWKNNIGGRTVWGHGGSDYGARAQMHFDPETKIGVVVLTNGEVNPLQIVDKLFEFAENLHSNSPPLAPEINGPSFGKVGISYNWTFLSTDPEEDNIAYYIEWGDNTSNITDYYPSGTVIKLQHTWNEHGIYNITAKAKDINDAESNWSDPFQVKIENNLPDKPDIDGPSRGKSNTEYDFTFNSIDPDGDDIAEYIVDWGDGSAEETISGPFASGEDVTRSYSWTSERTFTIKAKAKDTYGAESNWSEFKITIPKTKTKSYSLFFWLFERFPLLERILGLSRIT
jgi:CubicO group peptidase (beta-lactamase class C family)